MEKKKLEWENENGWEERKLGREDENGMWEERKPGRDNENE